MLITDSPFAVGTPEHNEWVRNTFIPIVEHERSGLDGPRVGAESQGRQIIIGTPYDTFDEHGNVVRYDLTEAIKRAEELLLRQLMPAWVSVGSAVKEAVNQFAIFFEKFEGLISAPSRTRGARARLVILDDPPAHIMPARNARQILDEAYDPLKSVPVALEDLRPPLADLKIHGVPAAAKSYPAPVEPWREPWRRR